MDVTNHTTRWGVWSPEVLNLNQSWADEHGLNSLEILSGLLSVYKITKKEDYLTAWKVSQSYYYDNYIKLFITRSSSMVLLMAGFIIMD